MVVCFLLGQRRQLCSPSPWSEDGRDWGGDEVFRWVRSAVALLLGGPAGAQHGWAEGVPVWLGWSPGCKGAPDLGEELRDSVRCPQSPHLPLLSWCPNVRWQNQGPVGAVSLACVERLGDPGEQALDLGEWPG